MWQQLKLHDVLSVKRTSANICPNRAEVLQQACAESLNTADKLQVH